jgi:hypothetical protein
VQDEEHNARLFATPLSHALGDNDSPAARVSIDGARSLWFALARVMGFRSAFRTRR